MAATPIIDQYSPLSHKMPLRENDTTLAPTWVPKDQQRRLDAYKVLAAYRGNVARNLIPDTTEATRRDHREYGDAELLVQRASGGVLGDQITFVVDGADDDLPDMPDLPPEPDPLPADANDLEKRIHAARTARWLEQATKVVDDWEAAWAAQPALQARQEWIRDWAEKEFVVGKIVENDDDATGLGDGVFVLSWSPDDQRVTVDVYDPGFYFPVLTEAERGFPSKVHLAWEFERTDPDGKVIRYVRRLTFHLTDILLSKIDHATGDFRRNEDGTLLLDEGERYDPETGRVLRIYPWAEPVLDDNGQPTAQLEESPLTCLYTDATWKVADLEGGVKVDDFTFDKAVDVAARDLDLRCDFVTVLHVPNTPATREHFGTSVLDVVAQILDDLATSDTDVQAASALAAGPVIALAGGVAPSSAHDDDEEGEEPAHVLRAGEVWGIDKDGSMSVLDLSAGLETLAKINAGLQDRLSVNSRVPAEVLGRHKEGSGNESGFHRMLTFGPFTQLIELLRLTRVPKYQLFLKMVQRLAQAGGVLPPGPNPVARVAFGAYLPSDLNGVVDVVVSLIQAHVISRHTGLQLLVEAGVPIDDVVAELARVEAEDTAAAVQIADATGSESLAAEKLGLELPETTPAAVAPPTLNLPAPPPTG